MLVHLMVICLSSSFSFFLPSSWFWEVRQGQSLLGCEGTPKSWRYDYLCKEHSKEVTREVKPKNPYSADDNLWAVKSFPWVLRDARRVRTIQFPPGGCPLHILVTLPPCFDTIITILSSDIIYCYFKEINVIPN
ncbi:hypothetical protein CDAR_93741 [Caerostris darwini]|uniref:Uncharacterized protein n=1 Tax=Caerostris darwini TaxID=1538125 RepID=A0AAV4NMU8_9ARAC|nr:hypothetical protein CDAR_93741 [Caerostris darwini]